MPTWVELAIADQPLVGYVNTDNIETLGRNELDDYLGALSPATMDKVNGALAVALALL